MKRIVAVVLLVAASLAFAETGAQYLVICPDALYSSVLPLVQWKQATGLTTKVAKLSETGSDTLSIRNYVRNAWNTWLVKPEYLLLVGSGNLLPARLYFYGGYLYCSSDNIYGNVTGNIEAEIVVGRLPATTTAQLDVMVAKTLQYESEPDITDSLWMRRLTTIIREGGDQDDTLYWSNIRNAARKAATAGFVNCDSLSYFRGNSSTDVINSCNRGTGLVLYRGSAQNTWYEPFDHIRPSQFTSTNKLPIVTSVSCQTMSLSPISEPTYGDSFMIAGTLSNLHGAVAFFGNTHPDNNVARQRGAVARGFYNGLFDEGIYKLGKTALRAKHQLYTEFPSATADYNGFNLLGDPDLGIWTATPKLLAVTHDSFASLDSQDVTVTVLHDSVPVESALVCASMDTTVFVTGYTDSLGQVLLAVHPAHEGSLRLVVTGRNLYPYDTLLPVINTAVAEPPAVAPAGATGLKASPTTFAGSTRISWNAARAAAAVLAIYDATGRTVGTWTVSGASRFDWNSADAQAGVYLCVLRSDAGTSLGELKVIKTN